MFIKRDISHKLQEAANQLPVVFLTGPRQSGKTTLLQRTFSHHRYVNLEEPDFRQWAIDQPRDFLDNHPWPLIIDEAQHAPELFSYIQGIVDRHQKTGMYLLSGSQNFLLMEKISQSLAGRSAVMSLLPLSWNEISGVNTETDTNEIIIKGFFPRIFQSVKNVSLFYRSYLNTYVERDVRQLANIGNTNDFARFIKLCAGRCGQLLNISSLASEAGIAYNTCKAWLSYLTAGYVIQLLQPWHKNFNKKIVKAPKIYFTDTGLLCHLLGINTAEELAISAYRGAIFENLVLTEIQKNNINNAKGADIWFWRDNHGTEIDVLVDKGVEKFALEVKSGKNVHDDYLKNLLKFSKYSHGVKAFLLIYDGPLERTKQGIQIVHWKNIPNF